MAFNTGNPLGSKDVKDLFDNAENLDSALNSVANTWTDRLGVVRTTVDKALRDVGFEVLGDYAASIQITSFTQVVRESGEFYRLKASEAIPYTTTGTWGGDDENRFVSVGDAVLRGDLIAAGGVSLVGNAAITFDNVASMVAATWLTVGQKVRTLGYYTPGDGGGNDYEIVAAATGTDDGGSFIDLTGISGQAKGLFVDGVVNVKQFGAKGDGVTDDASPLQLSVTFSENNSFELNFLRKNYITSSVIRVKKPVHINGNMCSIFQSSTTEQVFLFDEGVAGAGNYQNGYLVENIIVRTETGTGHAFEFRNINESVFRNLFVVGCGDTAFYIKGCLLNKFEHCYVGNGLTAAPGFFKAGAVGSKNGFITENFNNLGPNANTFDRCSATNQTVCSFDISGTGNTLLNCDSEGITTPAVSVKAKGIATSVISGNYEGTGGNIEVTGTNCFISGANVLGAVIVEDNVYGTTMSGGNVKQIILRDASFNNSVIGTRIGTGGFLSNLGTDNHIINVYDPNTSSEKGNYISGTFTPKVQFGGADGVSAYFQQRGSFWRNGNVVNFTIWLQVNTFTAATGAVTVNMNDIPYTAPGFIDIPCNIYAISIPVGSGNGVALARIDAGTKTIKIEKIAESTGVLSAIQHSDLTSADTFMISGFIPLTRNT